ncbi:YlxQ family RNA-binding protein [Alteribacter natronophilus]|uniref:YlxQ family RNA-binding protein n=1 Tax=Alteribacter natronophilus TaxID=2583810 RepID=UPI00110DBD51|nr:YlxQ family RNA-binding protein [Alteribacter natronophilus]TMW73247.1 YlxQ family RNA-binding protein [Alteribacter natronophilus]
MDRKALNLIGLAYRARAVVTGEEVVLRSVRAGHASLVIISEDASANTKKKFTDKCSHYKIPCFTAGTRQALGQAVGKEERVVMGVEDSGFAEKLKSLLE